MARPLRQTPLGPFDRHPLLSRAISRAGGSIPAPVTVGSGLSISVKSIVGATDAEAIRADKDFKARFNKIMRNLAGVVVRDAQRAVRETDTIDTRLFLTSWRATVDAGEWRGLRTLISVTNDAPYAGFVHPKGRKQLVVDYIKDKYLGRWKREATQDIAGLKVYMAKALKARALAASKKRGAPKAAK